MNDKLTREQVEILATTIKMASRVAKLQQYYFKHKTPSLLQQCKQEEQCLQLWLYRSHSVLDLIVEPLRINEAFDGQLTAF